MPRWTLFAFGLIFGIFITDFFYSASNAITKVKNRNINPAFQVADKQVYIVRTFSVQNIDWRSNEQENDVYFTFEWNPSRTIEEAYEVYLKNDFSGAKLTEKEFQEVVVGLVKKGQLIKVKWIPV